MARGEERMLMPAHITAISNRVELPKQFSDRLPWLSGHGDVEGWLLLVDVGRYRLLSDEQVREHETLSRIRLLLLEGPPGDVSDAAFANNSDNAAVVAKLMPVKIGRHRELWRIALPRDFDVFAPDCNLDAFSVLFSPEGYCEIWYTEVLRRNATVHLRKQLHW